MGRTKNPPARGGRVPAARRRGVTYASVAELRAAAHEECAREYERLSGETLPRVGAVAVFEPRTPEVRTAWLVGPRTALGDEAADVVHTLRVALTRAIALADRIATATRIGPEPEPYAQGVAAMIHGVARSGAVDPLLPASALFDPNDPARLHALQAAVWAELPARAPRWPALAQTQRDRLAAVAALLCGDYPMPARTERTARELTVARVIELAKKAVQSTRKRHPGGT
jgi:hypothetical protein